MSYCVNCGVELDSSAKKCALCGTVVINPNEKETPDEKVAPFSAEPHIPEEVKKRFVASVISMVMLIPNIVCILLNAVLFTGGFWSLYICSTSILLWVIFVFPFFTKKLLPFVMWAFDTFAVSLYVYFFSAMGSGKWFLGTALPIILINSFLIVFYMAWTHNKKRHLLLKTLFIFACLAVSALLCGLVLSVSAGISYAFEIGIIVFVSLAAVAAFLGYCYSSKTIRRWLSKRFFQ